jgi:mRNA interferase MazF
LADHCCPSPGPAVVLSNKKANDKLGHTTCAMITSQKNAPWAHDVVIKDLKPAGLPAPSVICMKIFTIDNRLILKQAGELSERDLESLSESLKKILG